MPVAGRLAVHPHASRVEQPQNPERRWKDQAIVEQVQPQLGAAVQRGVASKALGPPAAQALAAADEGQLEPRRIAPDLPATGAEPDLPAAQAQG